MGFIHTLSLVLLVALIGGCSEPAPAPVTEPVTEPKPPMPVTEPKRPMPELKMPVTELEPAPMPAFPWPPPPASAETIIAQNWLPSGPEARLAGVADTLERALIAAKYRKYAYLSVPNGFALVSEMEQIGSDGTPSPEPARWSADLPPIDNITLVEFIKALVNAQPGYYRVIVFIVTDQPRSRNGEATTGKQAETWLLEGFDRLSPAIGELPYGSRYRTTALVYEFKKISNDTSAVFLEESPTHADKHLERSGISGPLSRRP